MSWHAGASVLARYRNGTLGPAQASSVDAHLLVCAECRHDLAALVIDREGDRLDRLWAGVTDVADAPRPGAVERLLRAAGVRDHVARLLAATHSLTASWLLGIGAVLFVAVLMARSGTGERGTFGFLLVAPLLPLAGVAAAFGRRIDPTGELGAAAPMHGFQLLLVRSVSVLVTTLTMVGAACLAVPATDWRIAAWLLPALALTTTTLLLATWAPVVLSATVLGGAWVTITIAGVGLRALRFDTGEELLERSVAFQPAGQLALALCTVAAAWMLARRRDSFDLGGIA